MVVQIVCSFWAIISHDAVNILVYVLQVYVSVLDVELGEQFWFMGCADSASVCINGVTDNPKRSFSKEQWIIIIIAHLKSCLWLVTSLKMMPKILTIASKALWKPGAPTVFWKCWAHFYMESLHLLLLLPHLSICLISAWSAFCIVSRCLLNITNICKVAHPVYVCSFIFCYNWRELPGIYIYDFYINSE